MTHEKFKIQRKGIDHSRICWINTNHYHGIDNVEASRLCDMAKKNNNGGTYRVVKVTTTEEEIYQC